MIVVFLTEFTSNTATAETLLPLAASISTAIGFHPLMVMVPLTLACSMAFMMPVATPPNAIVFSSGQVRVIDMVKAGFVLNLIAIITITVVTYFWGSFVFDV